MDRKGIRIPKVGKLPLGCAAVCEASINVQRMAVEAAMTGDVTLLKQAAMLDPLTGAVCDPNEISQLIDEMLIAQAKWLPQYRKAIPAARPACVTKSDSEQKAPAAPRRRNDSRKNLYHGGTE